LIPHLAGKKLPDGEMGGKNLVGDATTTFKTTLPLVLIATIAMYFVTNQRDGTAEL
jgi:hypothetical protein